MDQGEERKKNTKYKSLVGPREEVGTYCSSGRGRGEVTWELHQVIIIIVVIIAATMRSHRYTQAHSKN